MSELIAIVGESGVGKSTSILKNDDLGIVGLDPTETFIISVANKGLPTKGWKQYYKPFHPTENPTGNWYASDKSANIRNALNRVNTLMPNIKNIVIEDSHYSMSFDFMRKALEKGYEKFNSLAKDYFDIIDLSRNLRDDLTVYFISHSEEIHKDFEVIRKMKTLGNMIDSKITLEGLFNIVLYAASEWDDKAQKGNYFFITNRTNDYPSKSPNGMFPDIRIPNDLGFVSKCVHEYYN